MKKKQVIVVGVFVFMITFIFVHGKERYQEWQTDHCGVPDLVSSRATNNDHRLTVVANRDEIEDKEEFAREVIRMCRENSFRSIMFSTDAHGYPSRVDISVYLKRKDIGEQEPVCEIRFEPLEYNEEYDIKNDVEQFHLYLDNEEIPFY